MLAALYGPALVGAMITSVIVVWQNNHSVAEVKKQLMERLKTVNQKLDLVHQDARESKALILINGHHLMTALDGNKQPTRQWLTSVERSTHSGGTGCGSTTKD